MHLSGSIFHAQSVFFVIVKLCRRFSVAMSAFEPIGFIVDHSTITIARDGVVERIAKKTVSTIAELGIISILLTGHILKRSVKVNGLYFKCPTALHTRGTILETHPKFEGVFGGKVLRMMGRHVEIHDTIVRAHPLRPVRRRLAGRSESHLIKAVPPQASHHTARCARRKFSHTVVAQRVAIQSALPIYISIEARRHHPGRKE